LLTLRGAAALACLAVGSQVLLGCGGSDPEPPEEPPAVLLERALAAPISSGEVEIDAEVVLEDSSLLEEPASFSASGPFELRGAAVPRFDLDFDASVAGYGIGGELVSDGEDGYVVFFGENYRLGSDHIDNADRRLSEAAAGGLAVDPASWIARPRYDGSEEVGGEHCHRIEGALVPERLATDLRAAGDALGLSSPGAIAERLRRGTIAFFATSNGALCGLGLDAELSGPGSLELDLRLSDLGEPQEIERPEGGGFQAVEELLARFERLGGVTIEF
jgi:hypothetical protein